MTIQAGSPYEIPISEDSPDPDFTYETDDQDEKIYALIFLGALATLFKKYKDKSADYVIKNVDSDVSNLRRSLTHSTTELEKVFDKVANKTLTDAGILKDNLGRVTLKYNVHDGVLEQKQTVQGVTDELKNNLKSKAYYLKNRNAESIFNVKSNFNRAAKRLKQMVWSGYQTAKKKAVRASQIFLYGDPLAYWITKNDNRVCLWCMALQKASPMPLSMMPFCPLHNKCRCDDKLAKDLELTDAAKLLTYYQIGVTS